MKSQLAVALLALDRLLLHNSLQTGYPCPCKLDTEFCWMDESVGSLFEIKIPHQSKMGSQNANKSNGIDDLTCDKTPRGKAQTSSDFVSLVFLPGSLNAWPAP